MADFNSRYKGVFYIVNGKTGASSGMHRPDCRQSPRLFAEDFSVLKRLKVSIFKTFQSLFGIIKVSKKAVLFYDDTRNRKSKKANADGMY